MINAAMGVVVGAIFGLALLTTDALGMRSLVTASADVVGTTVVFLVGCATTFTPLVIATAIGTLREAER
jgi:hypothetical protein